MIGVMDIRKAKSHLRHSLVLPINVMLGIILSIDTGHECLALPYVLTAIKAVNSGMPNFSEYDDGRNLYKPETTVH